MDYFYSPPEQIHDDAVSIEGVEFAHLTHVMRKREGDAICVVDGLGNAYDVVIGQINQKAAHGKIVKKYVRYHEPAVDLTLAVGVLKNPSKFDFLVEKVAELGVKEIIPLTTERTIPSHAKVDRWQKLALAAMKQSGRSFLPIVRDLMTLDEVLTERDLFDLKIIAHEEEVADSRDALPSAGQFQRILILVGPEGGFTLEEVERCRKSGFHILFLGNRRLRTETAAVVASAFALLRR
ncbi:MAG TPA: RsmE family RNA methyltransferase [Bacteroidota bacterium]|nr:RsmE family RNA methyltransferase [Bacteroidota bacterium]